MISVTNFFITFINPILISTLPKVPRGLQTTDIWESTSIPPQMKKWYNITALKTAESRGRTEGKIEGKIEGELETLRKDIIDILSERFGVIKADLSNKLGAIDDPVVLRILLKKSVTVASLEEFISLLGKL